MERQRLRNGFNPRSEHRMRWLSGTLRSQATPCRCVLGGHLGCTRQRVQPRGVEEQRPGTVAPTKAHVQSEGQKKRGLLWPFHPEPPLRVHNVSLPSACCIRRPFPQHGHTHLERQGLLGWAQGCPNLLGFSRKISRAHVQLQEEICSGTTRTPRTTRVRAACGAVVAKELKRRPCCSAYSCHTPLVIPTTITADSRHRNALCTANAHLSRTIPPYREALAALLAVKTKSSITFLLLTRSACIE